MQSDKLFEIEAKEIKRLKGLNELQRAQLQDCAAAGSTVTMNRTPKSMNKGYLDTPLFGQMIEQTKLF